MLYKRSKGWGALLIGIPIVCLLAPIDVAIRWNERRRWPKTLHDAVERLIADLSEPELERIRSDGDGIDWYSFGQGVRNDFGLWSGNVPLMRSCGVLGDPHEADAASGIIIQELKHRLTPNHDPG